VDHLYEKGIVQCCVGWGSVRKIRRKQVIQFVRHFVNHLVLVISCDKMES